MTTNKEEALDALENLMDMVDIHSDCESEFDDSLETIRAALEADTAPEPCCEWQPIETAPAGCWIIIHAYDCVMQACWNANGHWTTYENGRVQPEAATHWQPLPPAPKGNNNERD